MSKDKYFLSLQRNLQCQVMLGFFHYSVLKFWEYKPYRQGHRKPKPFIMQSRSVNNPEIEAFRKYSKKRRKCNHTWI